VDDGKDGANLVVASTYPRDIQLPDNRHDNDKRDITAQDCSAKATYV
jgi:hypothetical protein